jgi:chemotaxis signal transduction protein
LTTLDATDTQSWCLIRIDGRPCAFALHAVAEIVEAEQLVRLPIGSPKVLGLCTYHRDLVPVIALSDTPPDRLKPVEGHPVVLILRAEHGPWGIRIDRRGAIVADGPLDEDASPSEAPAGSVVIGSITRSGVVFSAIDAEATWRATRDSIEDWYKHDRVFEPPQ